MKTHILPVSFMLSLIEESEVDWERSWSGPAASCLNRTLNDSQSHGQHSYVCSSTKRGKSVLLKAGEGSQESHNLNIILR